MTSDPAPSAPADPPGDHPPGDHPPAASPANADRANTDRAGPTAESERKPIGVMPLGDHLEELRNRLLWAMVGIAPVLLVTMYFGETILGWVTGPLQSALRSDGQPASLQATGPLETIGTYFKIALIVTIVVGAPWVLYQIWKFIAPGLYAHERRFVYFLLPMSTLLSVTGVMFLYFMILPVSLGFLVHFGSDIGRQTPLTAPAPEGTVFPSLPVLDKDPETPAAGTEWINRTLMEKRIAVPTGDGSTVDVYSMPLVRTAGIQQQYRVSEYVDLVLSLALGFAAGFQMPVVILVLGWIGIIDQAFLSRWRRHALFGCMVLGAILTPGDPVSLLMLGIPLYLLYEVGGILLRVLPPSRIAEGFIRWPGRGKKEPASAGDE